MAFFMVEIFPPPGGSISVQETFASPIVSWTWRQRRAHWIKSYAKQRGRYMRPRPWSILSRKGWWSSFLFVYRANRGWFQLFLGLLNWPCKVISPQLRSYMVIFHTVVVKVKKQFMLRSSWYALRQVDCLPYVFGKDNHSTSLGLENLALPAVEPPRPCSAARRSCIGTPGKEWTRWSSQRQSPTWTIWCQSNLGFFRLNIVTRVKDFHAFGVCQACCRERLRRDDEDRVQWCPV